MHDLRSEVTAQLAGFLNGIRFGFVLLAEHHEVEALGADADRQAPEVVVYGKLPRAVEIERHDKRVLAVLCVKVGIKKPPSFLFHRTVANWETNLLLQVFSDKIQSLYR